MKSIGQFFILLRYHIFTISPLWLGQAAAIVAMDLIELGTDSIMGSINGTTLNFGFLFGGIIGIWVLAPWSMTMDSRWNPVASFHNDHREFEMTRAINRRMLFRARTVAFLLMLMLPCVIVGVATSGISGFNIDLDYLGKKMDCELQERCLHTFAGSELLRNENGHASSTILIPNGRILKAVWMGWWMICFGAAFQALIAVLPVRGKMRRLGPYLSVIPMAFLLLIEIVAGKFWHFLIICSFLLLFSHPIPTVGMTLALGAGIQWWCEWRFAMAEPLI